MKQQKKYTVLTPEHRGRLIGKWEEGVACSTLAKEFNLSPSAVYGIVARYKKHGTAQRKKGSGRPTKLTGRNVRALLRSTKATPRTSFTEHAAVLREIQEAPISRWTVARCLKKYGFSSRVAAKVPFLNRLHRNKRLAWARAHDWPVENWAKVVFSDESRFSQFSDGQVRVIRQDGTRYEPKHTVPTVKQCTSVMVWGCFWRGGVGPLVFLTETMNQEVYVNTLAKHFYEWKKTIEDEYGISLILLEDNASPHKADYATWWKRLHGIETLDWPPQSPDLNPIENIWGIIKKRLQQRGSIFTSVDKLMEAVREEWNRISVDECRRLSDSMVERVRKAVDKNGYSIGK